MKLFNLLFLSSLLCCLFALTSCEKEDDKPVVEQGKILPNGSTLEGDLSSNIVLSEGNTYFLRGGVHVKSGNILTIQKGVTVKSDPNEPTPAYLLIEPGAKISAIGTMDAPIVFTSGKSDPKVQDWGGIILCGKAVLNVAGGSAVSEMGGIPYGGTDDQDNSGIIQFVRVEYTGQKASNDKEHNGFTFEGVGSGTIVDHIAVYKGADDGIEFFGGTVNVKYAFVYGAQDDNFDWTYGWRGKGQHWVAIQASDAADRGIEADNNGDNQVAFPYSDPLISNVTLIGAKINNETRAIKLREGTKGRIYNVVVYGFDKGVEVEHDPTLDNMNKGALILANSYIGNTSPWSFKKSDGTKVNESVFTSSEYFNIVKESNASPEFLSNVFIGVHSTNAKDPKQLDNWFDTANFIGAVNPNNNWTDKWTRFE